MKLTITEALAEIKTIGKRLEAKRAFIKQNLGRPDGMRDPLERDGGSVSAIQRELQAVGDLNKRLIALRIGIMRGNDATEATVNGVSRTVAQWLTWKRDVAPGESKHWAEVASIIKSARGQARGRGANLVQPGGAATFQDVIINLDEGFVAKQVEALETTLGELDGKLSLINATTLIEIPE